MKQLLIDVVFAILNFVSSIFLDPVFRGVSALFPSLSNFFTKFFEFLAYGLNYLGFVVKTLMIPTEPLIIFITIWAGIFTFTLTLRAIGLGMAVYHYFKP